MCQALWRWAPVVLWAMLIYFGSEIPDPYVYLPERVLQWMQNIILGDFRLNRILGLIIHFLEFVILAYLLARAFHGKRKIAFWPFLAALDFALLYGLFDEIHQTFVPGRLFETKDLAVDAVGVGVGLAFYVLWQATGFERQQAEVGKATTPGT